MKKRLREITENDLNGLSPDALKAKGHTTFYHGTSSDHVASIKKNGLRPAKQGEGIYLSTNALQAGRWGEMKYPGSKIAVVKLNLNKSMHNVKGGNRGSWDNEYSHVGEIPHHAVQGFKKHNIGD